MEGARIRGALHLAHSTIAGPVWLRHCEFDSDIDLSGARTREVDLYGSRLAGVTAPLATIDGNLVMTDCHSSSQIVLAGGHITGGLQLQRSRLDCPGGEALLANRLVIDDDLLAQDAVVNGELMLAGAHVGGMIGLEGSVIRGGGRFSFNGFGLSVDAGLCVFSGMTAEGTVILSDSRLEGNVEFL
jgi:hypothetical protein